MKPFWAWAYVFCLICLKKSNGLSYLISWKSRLQADFFSLKLQLKLAQISPPNQKSWLRPCWPALWPPCFASQKSAPPVIRIYVCPPLNFLFGYPRCHPFSHRLDLPLPLCNSLYLWVCPRHFKARYRCGGIIIIWHWILSRNKFVIHWTCSFLFSVKTSLIVYRSR